MRAPSLQRLLRHRWARAFAIVGTYLLCLQSLSLPRLFAEGPAQCCCAHRDADCACKACTHDREVASGRPMMKSCGTTDDLAVTASLDDVLPAPAEAEPPPRPALPTALSPRELPPPDPARDVPTPPPLARS